MVIKTGEARLGGDFVLARINRRVGSFLKRSAGEHFRSLEDI